MFSSVLGRSEPAVGDYDATARPPRRRAHALYGLPDRISIGISVRAIRANLDDSVALDHLTKDDMPPVEPWCLGSAEEELGAIRPRPLYNEEKKVSPRRKAAS